jgi:hypothetical protein
MTGTGASQPDDFPASILPWTTGAGDSFLDSARNGGFTLTSEHADNLAKVLQDLLNDVGTILRQSRILTQPPPMTASPAGLFVSKVMHDTANDEQGMLTQLVKAQHELPKYIEALQLASKRYADTEGSTAAEIKSLNPES